MIFCAPRRQYGHDFKSRVMQLKPRLYFDMDEGSGSALVNRGGLGIYIGATITSTPTYQDPALVRDNGFAMTFNGSSSYAATAASGTIGDALGVHAIGCWASWTSVTTTLGLMTLRGTGGTNGDAPLVVLVNWPSVGNISVACNNNVATVTASSVGYNDGNKHFIVAGINTAGTQGILWVDGARIGAAAVGGTRGAGNLRLGLGANVFSGANLFYPGTIDNAFHIPSIELTDAMVLALYNAGIR
jgi:hypothetical protein